MSRRQGLVPLQLLGKSASEVRELLAQGWGLSFHRSAALRRSANATSSCSELLGLSVTGGYSYLVILGQDPSQVMVSAAGQAVQLVIAESGSGYSGDASGSSYAAA